MRQVENNRYSNGKNFRDMDLEDKVLSRSASFGIPPGKSKEEVLLSLKSRLTEGNISIKRSGTITRSLTFRIGSVAAASLLLVGIGFLLFRSNNNKVVADRGTHIYYRLPDGSHVTINADSRIIFNKREFTKNRRLILEGEAFFDVEKGSPFLISTENADIKVLGTSFNVYSRENLFKVSCISGKISVSAENQSVEVIPGESAALTGLNIVSYHDKNLSSSTSWIKGEFYFENSPLNLIFKEMERQFNIKFVATEMKEKYFTGSFTNIDLENALEIVCIPMGLKYEIGNNGKIFIREKTQ
jgi:transmembrane sensor